jgi:hypothetical protein
MTILNFRIKSVSFDWGWYTGSGFSILSIKIFEKVDPSWITLFCLDVAYFELSLILEREI